MTNGKFKFGAISQKIIKTYWLKNILISYKDFAKEWISEHNKGEIDYNELAYNKFMKEHRDKEKWFEEKKIIVDEFKNMGLL